MHPRKSPTRKESRKKPLSNGFFQPGMRVRVSKPGRQKIQAVVISKPNSKGMVSIRWMGKGQPASRASVHQNQLFVSIPRTTPNAGAPLRDRKQRKKSIIEEVLKKERDASGKINPKRVLRILRKQGIRVKKI